MIGRTRVKSLKCRSRTKFVLFSSPQVPVERAAAVFTVEMTND